MCLAGKRERVEIGVGSLSEKMKSRVGGVLFYLVLAVFLVGIFLFTGNDHAVGVPRQFLGFSAMRVLTGSMESELPQDSLILVRQVDPSEIQVGDDITFLVSETTTVTHRVINIYENHGGTGQRGFETQGIENANPDWEIVRPENIVGTVIWSNLFLGQTMRFISEDVVATAVWFVTNNPILSGVLAVLLIAFIIALKIFISTKEKSKKEAFREAQDNEINQILAEMIEILE